MAVEAQTFPSPPFSTEDLGPCELSSSLSTSPHHHRWIFWTTCGNDDVHCCAVGGDGDLIKNKIVCFLKLLPKPMWRGCLVQFWGLVKTRDKMYLTTRHQPFALLYNTFGRPDVNKLIEYRKLCLKYLIRTVDDDEISVDGEERVIGGPLSRAFRSGLTEYAFDVRDYTIREYPLRDFKVGRGYLALPVYRTDLLPSGVLEFASSDKSWYYRYPLKEIAGKLQEVDLITTCLGLAQVSSCQDGEIAKIEEALSEVDEILEMHDTQIWTTSGEILSSRNGDDFILKGQGVVGKAFSSKRSCFCRDIRRLNITEYPLAPIARCYKYSASFAVCLQSSCSNSCIYVLEFFLTTNEKDFGDPRTLLHLLMETLKEHLQSSFKIASGEELGEKLTVELIKVSPEDKFDSFEICNTTGIGIVGSPPRPEHVQGFVNISYQEPMAVQCNASNPARVDATNNSMNGIYERQNGIVGSSPRQELVQNVENIAHGEPSMEINVANPERDGVRIPQSSNEVINIKRQKSSYTLKSNLGITREVLEQTSSRNLEDAAKVLGVSRSTLKRICREYGIPRWPPCKVRKVNQAFAEQRVVQPSTKTIEKYHRPDTTRLEDDSCIWVKVEYQGCTMKFRLPLSARKSNLEEEVAQRLDSSIGSFKIEYQDEENDWIWIACDKDLSTCMNTLSSLGRTTIEMRVK